MTTNAAARVLVVEDDRVARELLEEILRNEGHEVEATGDGEEAIRRADAGHDLVITDVRLGDGPGGMEVLAAFQERAPQLPGREIAVASISSDEQLWLVNAFGDTEPGETFVFDRRARALALQYQVQETLPRTALAAMQSIRYKSADGLEIPASLTLPKGAPAGKLPARGGNDERHLRPAGHRWRRPAGLCAVPRP